jgi:hypothetical protein
LSEIEELVEAEPIGDLRLKDFANPLAAFNIAALRQ